MHRCVLHYEPGGSAMHDETRKILTDCGALLMEDHFVYASGDHGAGWIAKDLVNVDPRRPARLGELLATALSDLK